MSDAGEKKGYEYYKNKPRSKRYEANQRKKWNQTHDCKTLRKLYKYSRESLRNRIIPKVEIDEETGCWNWTGYCDRGDPRIKIANTTMSVRRVSWWAFGGARLKTKDPIFVQCDNRRCVNPNHLGLKMGPALLERSRANASMCGVFKKAPEGKRKVIIRNWRENPGPVNKRKRRRASKPKPDSACKLTRDQVVEIRVEWARRKYLGHKLSDWYEEASKQYGVSKQYFGKVACGTFRKDVKCGTQMRKWQKKIKPPKKST